MYLTSTVPCTEVALLKLLVPKRALFCTEQVMYRSSTPYVPKGTCTEEAPTRTTYLTKNSINYTKDLGLRIVIERSNAYVRL
jgi:hypothetical protein